MWLQGLAGTSEVPVLPSLPKPRSTPLSQALASDLQTDTCATRGPASPLGCPQAPPLQSTHLSNLLLPLGTYVPHLPSRCSGHSITRYFYYKTTKSCQFYLLNSQIHPFLPIFTATTLDKVTAISTAVSSLGSLNRKLSLCSVHFP